MVDPRVHALPLQWPRELIDHIHISLLINESLEKVNGFDRNAFSTIDKIRYALDVHDKQLEMYQIHEKYKYSYGN